MTTTMNADVRYWIPTGISPLDWALGGGIPSGKVIEIYGIESVAKTTLSLEYARAFINYFKSKKLPCKVLWIESESALDRVRAKYMGIAVEDFEFFESNVVEDIFDRILSTLENAKKNNTKYFIVLDTLAATKARVELDEKTKYNAGMMVKPRLINDNLARVVGILGASDSILCLPNQAYKSQGPGSGTPSQVSKGGMGPKYYSSIRIQLEKGFNYKAMLPSGEEVNIGIGVTLKTKKNKVFLPNQELTVILRGEKGIDVLETLVLFLTEKKLIKLVGSWKKVMFKDKEFSFQSVKKLADRIEKEPEWKEFLEYMNFLVFSYYCEFSPLLKIRFLADLWKQEVKFLGKKMTTLKEDEQTTYDYSNAKSL